MRKITAGLLITLDGVIEAPEKWNSPYGNDQMTQVVMGQLAGAGTHLYGRRSYELFRTVFTGPSASRQTSCQRQALEKVQRHARAGRSAGVAS